MEDVIIKLAGKVGPPLVAGIFAWLHGRAGRKIRVKVVDIDVTSSTMKEVKELLYCGEEILRRNRPKAIL